jgi:hypothetical protein
VLTIFSPHISKRLAYIVATLFGGTALITDNIEEYLTVEGPCINYSDQPLGTGLQIIPVEILQETGIREQSIEMNQWKELPVFFSGKGQVPFDIFGASFYLLSRYEEYLSHTKDEYGRYSHQNSLAYRYSFLDIPLVDYWMQELEKELQKTKPSYRLPDRSFRIQPSYDIDIAYRFSHRSPFKNIRGYFFDLLLMRFDNLIERAAVYGGRQKDSYDIYEWLDVLHQQYQLKPLYFFLLAEKQKYPDHNVDPYTRGMRQLIKEHAQKYQIGIHPSVQSHHDKWVLDRELKILAYHSGLPIHHSRQHYLKFQLPLTYRQLIESGIQQDHSMGYGAVNGFRASTSMPFYWYDIIEDEKTSLEILPFCYMDSAAIFHERLNTEMAMDRMRYFFETVKKINGVFSYVMHNHFLTEQKEWIMWRGMYETFLKTL